MIEKPFENWLPIPGYEGLYEIDTFGNIKSLDRKVRNNNEFNDNDKALEPIIKSIVTHEQFSQMEYRIGE